MAKYRAEVSKRLEAAFGGLATSAVYAAGIAINDKIYTSANQAKKPEYTITEAEPSEVQTDLSLELLEENDKPFVSPMGLPMYDTIEVSSPLAYVFTVEPLIDFSHEKNIVETEIQGGEDVVEIVSIRPVGVTIRGILWDNTGWYPAKQLKELLKVFKENTVLDVNSKSLNEHGVKSMYIQSLDTPALEGFEDTQPFVITARSSKAVELIILSNN